MIPFRKSIGFRILGISFILLALPLLVDSFILVQRRYEQTIADAKGYLVELAQSRELPLIQVGPLSRPLLDVMTYFLKLKADFPEKPNKELDQRLNEMASIGSFSGIFVLKITDEDQFIVVASNLADFVGRNYTNFFKLNDALLSEIKDQSFSSYISYDPKTLEPYLVVAHKIYSEKEKKYVGVLALSDDVAYKLEELLKLEDHHYPVRFALLHPSTVVFASTDPKLLFQHFAPLSAEYRKLFLEEDPFAASRLSKKAIKVSDTSSYPFFEFKWEGEEQIGYIKKLADTNFEFLVYASKDAIFHSPLVDFFHIYSVYALILILGGILAYILTRRMAKPIRSLSSVMLKIQEGELQMRYKKDSLGFEINQLGHIFNEMVDTVLEKQKSAEEARIEREIYARELRLGQQVQRSLFPQTMPKYPGVDLAEIYIPAIEVGGDFYDLFVKKNSAGSEQLALAIADASGKGVQACFYSLSVRNMLRTFTRKFDDVGEAMAATNDLFNLDTGDTGMFVTVLMGIYDHETQLFHYYSAGHNPPFIRREDGSIEFLKEHGMAMGVTASGKQEARSVRLNRGDTVIMYTDGVTEAHNEAFEPYEEQRLTRLVEVEGWRGAAEIVERIVTDVNTFAQEAPQHDDITLLVMKIV